MSNMNELSWLYFPSAMLTCMFLGYFKVLLKFKIKICFVNVLFQHLILITKEMVMEKPSPLLVVREFVRQYYTLLNKAPDFLHRY